MTDGREGTEERLERLKVATGAALPRADFAARVNAAVLREAPAIDWVADLAAAARRLVPIAALAAALGVIWAVRSERAWSEAHAAASAELDLQW